MKCLRLPQFKAKDALWDLKSNKGSFVGCKTLGLFLDLLRGLLSMAVPRVNKVDFTLHFNMKWFMFVKLVMGIIAMQLKNYFS